MQFVRVSVFWILALASASLAAEEQQPPSTSTGVPELARFQVIQSPVLAQLTFRLDRFTGDTWQLAQKTEGGFAWQRVPRVELANDTKTPGKVNYQLFLSGILAKVTILTNVNTGASWYIAQDPKQGIFWTPIN